MISQSKFTLKRLFILLVSLGLLNTVAFGQQDPVSSLFDYRKMAIDNNSVFTYGGYIPHESPTTRTDTYDLEIQRDGLVLISLHVSAKSQCQPMYFVLENGRTIASSDDEGAVRIDATAVDVVAGKAFTVKGPTHIEIVFGPEPGCRDWYGGEYELLTFFK